jgi:hypothetical protein
MAAARRVDPHDFVHCAMTRQAHPGNDDRMDRTYLKGCDPLEEFPG